MGKKKNKAKSSKAKKKKMSLRRFFGRVQEASGTVRRRLHGVCSTKPTTPVQEAPDTPPECTILEPVPPTTLPVMEELPSLSFYMDTTYRRLYQPVGWFKQQVKPLAEKKWKEAGCPADRSLEFWLAAENELTISGV